MRIVVNGWFLDQLATGSGQYLAGLAAWLPLTSSEHQFILVRPAASDRPPGDIVHDTETRGQGDTETRGQGDTETVTASPRHRVAASSPPGWQTVKATTPFDMLHRDLAKVWFEQIAFPQACRRLRADVALVPYWGSPWRRVCPTVVTIHDLIPLLLPLYRGGLLQRAYTWLAGRSARRADAVLTDSEAGRQDVVWHLRIAREQVHAVHLAADPRFRPVTDPGELARVREKYRLPESPFFLYLGGFDARKNVVKMVEAYAQATRGAPRTAEGTGDQGLGIGLVIAGALPSRDSAFSPDPRPLVGRLGIADRVQFVGWVDEADKPALYSSALAALYLSEYEGFGLPVLEAMACGCPMVAGGG